MPKLPIGLMGGLIWHRNNRDLGFGLTTPKETGDCYSLDVNSGRVERWTTSETAVNTSGLRDAELVRWKTFDGRTISGFLYRPPAKFTGKRPVLIEIHGGPEGQWRPGFLGSFIYYLNELGIAILQFGIGALAGHAAALAATSAAVCTSLADVPNGRHRTWRRVLLAALLTGLVGLLVSLTRHHVLLLGALTALIAFGSTMTLVWGPRAGAVSFVGILAYVFALATPESPTWRALLVHAAWSATGLLGDSSTGVASPWGRPSRFSWPWRWPDCGPGS